MSFELPGQRWNDLLGPGTELMGPRALLSEAPRQVAKPVFSLREEVADALDALEAGGAAVVRGQLVMADGDAAVPVPDPEDEPDPDGTKKFASLLGFGPSAWECVRGADEPWDAFVERAAGVARAEIARLGEGAAERAGGAEVWVDLVWVTKDEPTMFQPPAYLARALARVAETGRFYDWHPAASEKRRLRLARAVPGSFYGSVAEKAADVPRDARFVRIEGKARDLARLADLPRLETLVLWRANEKAMEVVGRLSGLRTLDVRESRLETLDGLERLPALELFVFAGATRLRDASALERVATLRAVWMDVSSLRSLDWTARLTQLHTLFVTGELTTLPTLAPLSALTRLRHLVVGHVRVKDRSLRPLHALQRLQSLEVPNRFPLEEIAALAAALPHTAGIPRQAFTAPAGPGIRGWCGTCRSTDVLLTVGSPRRTLCRACDDAKIRQYVLKWELALSQEHARAGTPPA